MDLIHACVFDDIITSEPISGRNLYGIDVIWRIRFERATFGPSFYIKKVMKKRCIRGSSGIARTI